MISAFRRRYGATPLHLVGHLVALAITVYAFTFMLDPTFTHPVNLLVYFVGGALVHDLVFLPIYTVLDAIVRSRDHHRLRVRSINHLRVPAIMSAVMFVVYWPQIIGHGSENYVADAGHAPPDFAVRWLLITVGLFAVSGAAYAARALRTR